MAGGNGGKVAVVITARRAGLAAITRKAVGARGVSFVAVVLKNRTRSVLVNRIVMMLLHGPAIFVLVHDCTSHTWAGALVIV